MSISSREIERRILRYLHDKRTRNRLFEIHAHFIRHQLHQSNQVLSHFVSVCRANGKLKYAELVFHQAHFPDLILFNSMIKGYSVSGPPEKSLALFSDMKISGVLPNEYTFAPLLKSCCNIRDFRVGNCVHGEIIKLGFERHSSVRIGIVELYANWEKMGDAKKVFDEMPHRDVIIWNLMIRGFCKMGDVDMGLFLFRQMKERSIVFSLMTVKHKLLPKLEHYGCMVDLLGRSGCLMEAYDLVRNMPMSPNAALWGALLSASRNLGDVQLAEHALKELINLEPWNSGNYVLLSNIYAEEGRWDEVDKLRLLMKGRSVKKSIGLSLVGQ